MDIDTNENENERSLDRLLNGDESVIDQSTLSKVQISAEDVTTDDEDIECPPIDYTEDENNNNTPNFSSNVTNLTDLSNHFQSRDMINNPKEFLLNKIKENSKFIPMRLTAKERKLLRLLEAALNVSEYTDKIDIYTYNSKAKKIISQLKEICSILIGLVVSCDLKTGELLIKDKDFNDNSEWFQTIFEIGRRYKIMNPEKLRDGFGKLTYMVMDSRLPEIKTHMGFDLYKEINTVYLYLSNFKNDNLMEIFNDELIISATVEIIPDGKSRRTIAKEIKQKENSIEKLAKKYGNGLMGDGPSKEDIRQCLYSIGDYHAYINANVKPVKNMIKNLESYFDSSNSSSKTNSLGINVGKGGARLSHSHSKQYDYVHQSLTLWSIIMRDMVMLWFKADEDLVSTKIHYKLVNTGQGLNRIKACPQVGRTMHNILAEAHHKCGPWVGSSVVHLGDHTVPNALFFLDKYLQVPRILIPIDHCILEIENLKKDKFIETFLCAQYGSIEDLKKLILSDFFKHAFDGSGADNFYDAGSCIDGRLTSAWNWANSISKKQYFKIFLLSGFTGFNGSDGF